MLLVEVWSFSRSCVGICLFEPIYGEVRCGTRRFLCVDLDDKKRAYFQGESILILAKGREVSLGVQRAGGIVR